MSRWAALLLVLVSMSSPALGASADEARARVLYESGKTHYELKQYLEAIRDFAAGYALSPRPEFLANLGQAYRAAGEPAKALEFYRAYLDKAPPTAAPRAEVELIVVELQAELDARKKQAADAPVAKTLEPEPPRAEVEVVPATRPVSPLAWALPVAGVVVVAVGTALAIGFATSVSCGPERTLGCHDLRSQP
jgi:tetratricopeptide (TPR) repeat protein